MYLETFGNLHDELSTFVNVNWLIFFAIFKFWDL